jgi:hypothetical protein
MKRLLVALTALLTLIVLIFIPMCVNAAPACYPGESTAAETVPDVVMQTGGACIVWHCDAGNKWKKEYICGQWSEVTTEAINKLKTLGASTKAEKDAAWAATFTQTMPADHPDVPLLAAAKATAAPATLPPSGLVTQSTVAYKQSQAINGYTVKPVGTVPLGKACTSASIVDSSGKRYYALAARTDATMNKVGGYTPPYPTTLYGDCQP